MTSMRFIIFQILTGFLLAVPFGFATGAGAQEPPPFATDRPSQSDASTLVPPGYLQAGRESSGGKISGFWEYFSSETV